MYLPAHFAEPRIEVLHDLMRARPLAALVTQTAAGLDANHVPLRLLAEPAPFGVLRGHVARVNPIWTDVAAGSQVLAIFQGPDAYVTPSWYPTKAESGKAVPTWNYAVAHAYGTLRIVDDPAWLLAELAALTAQSEAGFPEPWRVSDAPADYIEKMLAAVVGIEIVMTRLVGKWKTSQNQPPRNRAGVAQGLRAAGGANAADMAALVERPEAGRSI
jgi:transcriptional regulator